MKQLFNYFQGSANELLNQTELKLLSTHFTKQTLRKRQYLIQAHEVCTQFAYVLSGSLKQYYIDGKGTEHVVNLYIENCWAGDQESLITSSKSKYYIEACEKSEILVISKDAIKNLSESNPKFNKILLSIIERCNINAQNRIDTIGLTATERYENLRTHYPFLIKRFPKHIIASYLGITKDTYSKIINK